MKTTVTRPLAAAIVTGVLVLSSTGLASATEVPAQSASTSAQRINNIDSDALKRIFEQEMLTNGQYGEYQELQQTLKAIKQERGPKGQAAKAAIKAAIKAMKGIGKKAWDATINKLPVSDSVKKYLKYEIVMKVLNIATGFEGTVENMITNALTSTGIPSWAAGIAARAIVLVLL